MRLPKPMADTLIAPWCADLAAAGLQVHGLRAGRGTPLLLLHGWPEWSHVWRPVMSRLATRFDMVAPDLRAFGDTRPLAADPGGTAPPQAPTAPADDAGPDRHAADLLALADHLGWAHFGIVSHDVGSFVAQAIARQAPARVTGLFFFNCAYPGIGARWVAPRHLAQTWYQQFHQQPWAAALVGSSREACRLYLGHFLRHWSHRPEAFDDAAVEAWVDNFMKPGNLQGGFNWYRSVWAARLAVIEGRATPAPPITTPTRVFWGAHDPVLPPAWSDRLGEFFTDLQADLAPDAGHFVHWETPQRAAAEVQAFFGRIGGVVAEEVPFLASCGRPGAVLRRSRRGHSAAATG